MVLDITMADDVRRKQDPKEKEAKRRLPGTQKKADLMDVRVIQRHLVYAVGLAADICSDQILKGPEYFGKYGKIKKISVTWNNNSCSARQASAAAYVLFHTEEEAWNCIQGIDGVMWSGKHVRACYGTTKYCHSYLRKAACSNPECSYLHAPAPEADTVTKEEMNPITGRKDILHLVHPGGTPRSRGKKAPVRTASKPIDVPPAAAAAASTPDNPSPSPSKASNGWAIPAPDGQDLGTDFDNTRDTSSPEDSPQFVIAATAAPGAWPTLNELAGGGETPSEHATSEGSTRRPSAKDVVTGTASATDGKDAVTQARMLPLAAPARARFGNRGTVVNGSAALTSSASRELPDDEHALSTMPSTELLGSRARLDVFESADTSPIAPPMSPPAMMSGVASGALSTALQQPADDKEKSALIDSTEESVVLSSVAAEEASSAHTAAAQSDASGLSVALSKSDGSSQAAATGLAQRDSERVLSALDLLPASLEDALDGRASLPTTAEAEDVNTSPTKQNSNYPNASGAIPIAESGLSGQHFSRVHMSNRKQSRFAFVNDGQTYTSAGIALSLPHDLDSLADVPAFKPSGMSSAPKLSEPLEIRRDMRKMSAPVPNWDHGGSLPAVSSDERLHALKHLEGPLNAAAAVAHAQVQQQGRLGGVPSALEQPPMTHESVVQAVSAQLQAIMSQGGQSGGAENVGALPSQLPPGTRMPGSMLPRSWQSQPQKGPEQGTPEAVRGSDIQFLQALLQQELVGGAGAQERSAASMHASVSQGPRQGLAIKRPAQHPQAQAQGLGATSQALQAQFHNGHKLAPRNLGIPQRAAHLPPHERLHLAPHSLAPSMAQAQYSMQRGMQFASHAPQVSGGLAMDPAVARARAMQHLAQYGNDTGYMQADGGYGAYGAAGGGWDAVNDMYSGMLSAQQQVAHPRGHAGWHPRAPGAPWE